MIYTVTFNPSLDYIVSVEDFKLGLTNRTSSELMLPGGKGINVSTVLGNLGIESTALGFLAGFTGKEIAGRLDQMGIKNGCIWLEEGYSRINVKLKSIDGTEINGQGPKIPEKKVEELSLGLFIKRNPKFKIKQLELMQFINAVHLDIMIFQVVML